MVTQRGTRQQHCFHTLGSLISVDVSLTAKERFIIPILQRGEERPRVRAAPLQALAEDSGQRGLFPGPSHAGLPLPLRPLPPRPLPLPGPQVHPRGHAVLVRD